jgi:hypothetical protein
MRRNQFGKNGRIYPPQASYDEEEVGRRLLLWLSMHTNA